MGKVIYYEEGKVAATSWIIAALREIANKNGTSEVEVLSDFIQDLRNWGKEGYEYKVDKFIAEIDESVRRDLILKLSRELKVRQKAEKIRKKKEEREPQKEAKEKMEKERKAKETADRIEAEKKAKFNQAWEEICQIVREQSEGSFLPEYEFWIAAKKIKFPEDINKQLSGTQLKVKQKLEDEIYYQMVRHFTFDFEFLRQFPEAARATSTGRRICDRRYFELRDKMQKYESEYQAIQNMLNNPNTDEVTKRILESRLGQMQKRENYGKNGNER